MDRFRGTKHSCLNQKWSLGVTDARVVIHAWKQKYNAHHPHRRLGFLSPNAFAKRWQELNPTGTGFRLCAECKNLVKD